MAQVYGTAPITAGLAVVLDDDAHLLFLRTAEGLSLRRGTEVLTGVPLPPGPVRPGVRIRAFRHSFSSAPPGGFRQEPATAEATFLAPLFTSAHIGLYAGSQGYPSTGEARFPWFGLTCPEISA
ncbi:MULTISPECIES: hypothetical protein [unclassified Streptomyces]|uniref:hypothetical protein n=1 Tax=unclassified Streptomyces TaxID=2593676 RepID=UPI0036F6BE8B